MEVVVALAYLLVIIFPLIGGLWLGIRAENDKKRKLLKSMWTMRKGGKY